MVLEFYPGGPAVEKLGGDFLDPTAERRFAGRLQRGVCLPGTILQRLLFISACSISARSLSSEVFAINRLFDKHGRPNTLYVNTD